MNLQIEGHRARVAGAAGGLGAATARAPAAGGADRAPIAPDAGAQVAIARETAAKAGTLSTSASTPRGLGESAAGARDGRQGALRASPVLCHPRPLRPTAPPEAREAHAATPLDHHMTRKEAA